MGRFMHGVSAIPVPLTLTLSPCRGRGNRFALLERLAVALAVGDRLERLAVLLAAPNPVGWIAEGQDRERVERRGNSQQRVDLRQATEADPVRAHAFLPRGQQHRVDRAA